MAISHNEQQTGRKLSINGKIPGQAFLQNHNTSVSINFLQVDETPDYPVTESGLHKLGVMTFSGQQLETNIEIDRNVFEELRKNLMEYGDIEGIHIMITLGILSNEEHWQQNDALTIVQLDYAMKGDS
ncbi:MAG: hypothetical protein DIZ80_09095 [endosymbiont of Galathealinum brachiosum]|uniref:Uncharacterized protein n=1 Tax=endosymbiont of Galathealinum brachiosum TaxID=2200906 RepID=A0A370DC09_9GAMM|nr:MAG: hypothetical protein DIZ80_09095 [endosymbiont of Galathealinum brachiosum]